MFTYKIPDPITNLVSVETGKLWTPVNTLKSQVADLQAEDKKIREDFRSQFDSQQVLINAQDAVIAGLKEVVSRLEADFAAIEEKLDFVLGPKVETGEQRSIPDEPLALQAGRKPWSQRKKERIQKSMSPAFIEKVIKGAAITEPEPVATEE